jgi:tetratricopeptide (TPR) repeat protein
MGGIGKTELAVQYAWEHLRQKTYLGGVIWLKAREDVATQIVLFARSLPMPQPPDDFELAAKVAFYWHKWQEAKTLVILDDVQDYGAIKSLLPVNPHFKILLTTRSRLQSPVQDFEIKVLSEEKAIELLRAIATDGQIDQQIDNAKQICEWLGYLPLGLELVGRYLARKRDLSLAMLWQRLQEKRLEAKALKDATPEMTATLGVAAAFELSWEVLDEPAQQLAGLLSLFALAEIPWTFVEACFVEEYTETLEDLRDESLLNLHLLERTGQGLYQLHQLLREFFAAKREQRAEADAIKQTLCQVLAAVAEQMPTSPTRSQIEEWTVVIPHLKEATTTLQSWLTDADVFKLSTQIAQFYAGQAAYAEALPWSQQCLEISETRLGRDHPYVALSLNNLAGLYKSQGRYPESELLYTRALAISEQQWGKDHSAVAINLNNLAELYKSQGRYAEAEPLFVRSLAIRERQLGVNHPDVAQSLNNLAGLYYFQGCYSKAESLYVRALNIWERQLGAEHLNVAKCLNNLAGLYREQGRYAEVESLCRRSLRIMEQQLGAEHPDVAQSLNNLANLYQAKGRCTEAEPLYLRSLKITEQQLGVDHPDVAQSLNNLAELYRMQRRYAKAEPLYLRSIAIDQRCYGDNHPEVATDLNNLAELYKDQGRYSEAEPLYLRALTILFNSLGQDHPNSQTVWNNFQQFLAQVLQERRTRELSDHQLTQDLLEKLAWN